MRFLLDVHIASRIGRALTQHGHDVLSAVVAHATWSDADLLALAVTDDRVIVTEDRDFSDLIFRDTAPPPPAVIYLRFGVADQPGMVERLLLVLANTTIDNHMIVIRRTSVRSRVLPEKQARHG